MKRKLTMLLMTVVMLAGVLAGCGGKSSKHVEMSDSARQAFIDYAESGDSGSFVIIDYEKNGAPIILRYYRGDYAFIYRRHNGNFTCLEFDDLFDIHIDFENNLFIDKSDRGAWGVAYVMYLNPTEGISDFEPKETFEFYEDGSVKVSTRHEDIDTIEKLDKYLEETYPDAKPIEEFFSGDNVYNGLAELLDAWEEY